MIGKRKWLFVFVVIVMVFGLMGGLAAVEEECLAAPGQTFSDVPPDHPFFAEIEALVASGITDGYPDGTFRPSANVTRMAMAAFLARGLVLADPVVTVPTFSDVPVDHPFFNEIEALAASGITDGYPDGTFRPSANVTRMAMAAFLARGLALKDPGVTVPTFSDVPTDHPFFAEIEALAASGITTGYSDGTFRPSANVTRMAMAAFLARGLDLLVDVINIKDGIWYGFNLDYEDDPKGEVVFYVKDNTITFDGSPLHLGAAFWLGFNYDVFYWIGFLETLTIYVNNQFGIAGTYDEEDKGIQSMKFEGEFMEVEGKVIAYGYAYHNEYDVRSMDYYWIAFHEDDLASSNSMDLNVLAEMFTLEKGEIVELDRAEQ